MTFKSNLKVFVYSCDVCATISSLDMSFQVSHYCSVGFSQLGITDEDFDLLVACIAPYGTVKAGQ